MPDERRGLLTESERDILLGDREVSDNHYYTTVSRVRKKIGRLDEDIPALEQHGDLADELRKVVCGGGRDIYCPICGKEFDLPSNAVHHMAGATEHDLSDDEVRERSPDWWAEEQPNFYFDEGDD